MKKTVLAIMCIAALILTACSGGNTKKEIADGSTEIKAETKTEAVKGGTLFDIPKDKTQTYNTGDGTDLTLALREIPSEVFKGVGELNSAHIMLSKYGLFKYDVILKFKVKSGKDAAKVLTDYYRSIGAIVEEISNTGTSVNYKARFEDWGESVKINGYSTYLDVQLNVVKK